MWNNIKPALVNIRSINFENKMNHKHEFNRLLSREILHTLTVNALHS